MKAIYPHARLKEQAQTEGRSVNALVIEVLKQATGGSVDRRAAIRRRARGAGVLVVPSAIPDATDGTPSRNEVIAATRGAGTTVSDALAMERDGS